MNDIPAIISGLEQTPLVLKSFLMHIPPEAVKCRRISDKWSIHEHACHIATGDRDAFLDRWRQFQQNKRPVIAPLSGESYPQEHFLQMDLQQTIKGFFEVRAELVQQARNADNEFWLREAEHPEYRCYTPYIMLRHRLMHDYFHMYRIEGLWLSRDEEPPG